MKTLIPGVESPAQAWPVLICLLGGFRLLRAGRPVPVRSGGKTEALISTLALHHRSPVPRDTLLDTLWPDNDPELSKQALDSLIHSLYKLVGGALGGARPLLSGAGGYQLNVEAGVGTDIGVFSTMIQSGERYARIGDEALAFACYQDAVALYVGDLTAGTDLYALVERESLRARYLTLLGRLTDYHYHHGDYAACLEHARRLLGSDPCREDAHRMLMRCYMRSGERTQALRQFQLCQTILRSEFDADPEPATIALYELMRLHPQQFEVSDVQ